MEYNERCRACGDTQRLDQEPCPVCVPGPIQIVVNVAADGDGYLSHKLLCGHSATHTRVQAEMACYQCARHPLDQDCPTCQHPVYEHQIDDGTLQQRPGCLICSCTNQCVGTN